MPIAHPKATSVLPPGESGIWYCDTCCMYAAVLGLHLLSSYYSFARVKDAPFLSLMFSLSCTPVVFWPKSGSTFQRGFQRFLVIKIFLLVLHHSCAARNQHTHTLHIRYYTILERTCVECYGRCSSSDGFWSKNLAGPGPRVYYRNTGLREIYRLSKQNCVVHY